MGQVEGAIRRHTSKELGLATDDGHQGHYGYGPAAGTVQFRASVQFSFLFLS